eukprot:UN10319
MCPENASGWKKKTSFLWFGRFVKKKMEEQGAPETSIKQYYNQYIRLP